MDIKEIFNEEQFKQMLSVFDSIEDSKKELLKLLLELSEWKNGITNYLAKHKASEEWNRYQEIIPHIPEHLRLMLFLECVYTQQDSITDEQYQYFLHLCESEPDDSKKIRKHLLSNKDFEFPDDYITIYRGEHGLSDTEIGHEHTASKDVEHGISWTYEPSVAGFFAVRTQSDDCRVYTAMVHKKDVLLIYDNRTEAEVIIKPVCMGTELVELKEEKINCNIEVMRKYYAYWDKENQKYDFDEGE